MQEERAKAPPTLSIIPFHEMRIIVGTNNTNIDERRLRHWVVKSARSRAVNASDVFGTIVSILYKFMHEPYGL